MGERADLIFTGVPEGLDALVLARLLEESADGARQGIVVHVTRDDRRLEALEGQLRFFAPKVRVVPFPAWDTVPYDRVGPNPEIVAKRITALSRLALGNRSEPVVVLTTVNAILQRVPPKSFIRNAMKSVAPGQRVDLNRFVARLSLAGYTRTGTVMEPGEFAVRGGILDLFPPGRQNPVRLDFFGDTLESIKVFDAETQRTSKALRKLIVMPVSEVAFGEAPTALFRTRYVELFGGATGDDPLYEAVSAGSRYSGQEHWLPFFHETLETLLDYVDGATLSFDHAVDDAVKSRFEQVSEHYLARTEGLEAERFGAPPYRPVPPDTMYLNAGPTRMCSMRSLHISNACTPSIAACWWPPGRPVRASACLRCSPIMD
jgi:transcription-repair coupling factor (superfamily II helicase)